MPSFNLKVLFLDVGGVLLTNGWDRSLREKASEVFQFEEDEMDERHHLTFDTYEIGKISLDEYLRRVLFYKPRSFTPEQIKKFIFEAVQAFPDTIHYLTELKKKYRFRVGMVSNEGRELAVDRVERFQLNDLYDFFIVSSFVHLRKPDTDIYRLALDTAQAPPEKTAYIDDRKLFTEVAETLGIHGIHHTSLDATIQAFKQLGLTL